MIDLFHADDSATPLTDVERADLIPTHISLRSELNELEQKTSPTLDEYWRIMCRRRWWLILPAFVCWLLVWGGSWFLPAVFRSQSLILIEQQKVPEQYVVSNVSVDLQERLHSMTQQILSRTRLQRIIDDFHLYAKERSRLSPDGMVDLMRDDVKIELVQAPGRPGDLTAFRISYSATSPQLAQQVASQLTSLFIEEDLQAQQQQSENTTRFLETQLAEARTSLEKQEAKVRQFKTEYLGQLPTQMEGNLQILSGLQTQLQSAQSSLAHAQQQKLYLESLLDQYRTLRQESSAAASGGVQAPAARARLHPRAQPGVVRHRRPERPLAGGDREAGGGAGGRVAGAHGHPRRRG